MVDSSKTLWNLSVVSYVINKDWFVIEHVSFPNILENELYQKTENCHEITFVNDLYRNKIYQNYFIKMRKYKD
ncbi:MAG: hypothetical protein HFH31_01450 [Bacilli bacterium]|nr:hypothetical protein [Bacilli bacterium]